MAKSWRESSCTAASQKNATRERTHDVTSIEGGKDFGFKPNPQRKIA
jgi:hypothetical protein